MSPGLATSTPPLPRRQPCENNRFLRGISNCRTRKDTARDFARHDEGLGDILKLRAPGLLGCALSGAGPSIVVFYERGCEQVCDLVRQVLALHGHSSEALLAPIAEHGFTLEEGSEA